MILLSLSAAFAQGMPAMHTDDGTSHMVWAYVATAVVYLGYTAFLVVRGHQEKV